MTEDDLLDAIRGGTASYGYRPVDGDKKNGYETWLAIDGEEIPGGIAVLESLSNKRPIRQSMTLHLNFGSKGGAGTYALSLPKDEA